MAFYKCIFHQAADKNVHLCTLGNLIPKESLRTIGLRRPDGIMSYISKFQDDTMSLEVAEIRFSNLVL